MFNVSEVINRVRRLVNLPRTPIITSAGVKMRNPFNHKGEWIGWTENEVAAHFASIKQYKSTPVKENKNGCGRG
jgi:hypothetical protein